MEVVDSPRQDIDAPPMIDAPPQDLCTSSATCAAAMDLGSVSGDDVTSSVTASGYQSAWYKVRVTEDDSSPFANDLAILAQLTSPPGTNYDVYVYVNTGSDVVECTTPTGSGTSTGTTDQARLTWGETGRSRTATMTAARSRSRCGRSRDRALRARRTSSSCSAPSNACTQDGTGATAVACVDILRSRCSRSPRAVPRLPRRRCPRPLSRRHRLHLRRRLRRRRRRLPP